MSNEKAIIPTCIGFIMDGNRRFAKDHDQEAIWGHVAGKEKLFEVVDWVYENKIQHAIFYAFSTENWRRSEDEVKALMTLFQNTLVFLRNQAAKENRRLAIRIIGQKQDFSPELQAEIQALETETTYPDPETTIWIALSYGGRQELLAAINQAIEAGEKVDEASFCKLLWSAGMPDPDLVIRTGGEHRLSNFLPWQAVYSELFFVSTYWPAFTKEEFTRILDEYATRERRIGK